MIMAGCVAGAGGVARLHADALREVMRAEPRERAAWIVQGSRMAFIGVLGYLANMYRDKHRR